MRADRYSTVLWHSDSSRRLFNSSPEITDGVAQFCNGFIALSNFGFELVHLVACFIVFFKEPLRDVALADAAKDDGRADRASEGQSADRFIFRAFYGATIGLLCR